MIFYKQTKPQIINIEKIDTSAVALDVVFACLYNSIRGRQITESTAGCPPHAEVVELSNFHRLVK